MDFTPDALADSGYDSHICQNDNSGTNKICENIGTSDQFINQTPRFHKKVADERNRCISHLNNQLHTSNNDLVIGSQSENIYCICKYSANSNDISYDSESNNKITTERSTLNLPGTERFYSNSNFVSNAKNTLSENIPNCKYLPIRHQSSVRSSKEFLSPVYENVSQNSRFIDDSNNHSCQQKNKSSKKIQWLEQSDDTHVSVDVCKTNMTKPYTSTPYGILSLEWNITDSFEKKINLADRGTDCSISDNKIVFNRSLSESSNNRSNLKDLRSSLFMKTDIDSGIAELHSEIGLNFCTPTGISSDCNIKESNFISAITDVHLNTQKNVNSDDSVSSENSFESCVSKLDDSIDRSVKIPNSEPISLKKSADGSYYSNYKIKKSYSLNETSRHSPYKTAYLSHVKLGTPEKNELLYSKITVRNVEKYTPTKLKRSSLKLMKSVKKPIFNVNQENVNHILNNKCGEIPMDVTEIKHEPASIFSSNAKSNMDKILGIKNAKKVDFLKLFMEKTSNFQLVEKIYSYLNPKDLVNIYCSSKLGQLSVLKSKKSNVKRENYLQIRRLTKENFVEHSVVKREKNRHLTKSNSFPHSDKVSSKRANRHYDHRDSFAPNFSIETYTQRFKVCQQYHPYRTKQKSPEVSPSKREFNKYMKAQKHLLPGQTLTKCPCCNDPAKVDDNISVCLKMSCQYMYCMKCQLSECKSVLNYKGKDVENQYLFSDFFTSPSKSPPHLNTACGIINIRNTALNKNLCIKDDFSEDSTDLKQNEFSKDSDSSDSNDSNQFCDRKNLSDISNKAVNSLCCNRVGYDNDIMTNLKVRKPDVDINYEMKVQPKVQNANGTGMILHRLDPNEAKNVKSSLETIDTMKISSHKKVNEHVKYKRALFANKTKHAVRKLNFCSLDENSLLGYKKPIARQNSLNLQSVSELVRLKNSRREKAVDLEIDNIYVPNSPPKLKQEINIGSRKSKDNLRRL